MKSTMEEVADRLCYYNRWRREQVEGEQPSPKQIGEDLDYAIRTLREIASVLPVRASPIRSKKKKCLRRKASKRFNEPT